MIEQLKRTAGRRLALAGWAAAGAGIAVAVAVAQPAVAQPHHGHAWHGGWHGPGAAAWHGGHWHHGWYGSRFGWWWVVPGLGWTFYSAPIYPYPEPPPLPPPPAAAPAGPPPGAPPTWYYCADPAGYYPHVQRCTVPWQPVPAQ
jgi:hypothetical protein